MKKLKSMCILLPLLIAPCAGAQELALSTNMIDYLNFGTINLGASYGFARHWSMNAGVKYNPFSFNLPWNGERVQNRQQSLALGTRYWPWHIFSGWWMEGRVQYQEYNVGGIVSQETSEGDRFGGGLAGGYTYMLNPHLNIDFGAGIWAGYDKYTKYECPVCGVVVDEGRRVFLLPSELIVSLSYVF